LTIKSGISGEKARKKRRIGERLHWGGRKREKKEEFTQDVPIGQKKRETTIRDSGDFSGGGRPENKVTYKNHSGRNEDPVQGGGNIRGKGGGGKKRGERDV